VRQIEVTECGLICLAIVAKHFGASHDIGALRQKYQISSRGLTLRQIRDIASDMQMSARAVQCELPEVSKLRCPAILHWNANHFVVLLAVKKNKYHLHDPSLGFRKLHEKEFSSAFTGIALELSPTPSFTRRKEKSPLQLSSWFRLTRETYGPIGQAIFLSLVLQLYVLISPLYLQLAIDQGALKGDNELLSILAIGFALFCVFNSSVDLLRSIVVARLTAVLSYDMTLRLFRHMLRLPLPWFQRRKLADVISRFESITPIKELMSGVLVVSLVDGLLAVITLGMMFVLAPALASITLAGLSLYILGRLCSMPLSLRYGSEAMMAKIAEQGKRIESIRAIQTLKVMGAEADRESDWANKLTRMIKADQANSIASSVFSQAQTICDSLVKIGIIYCGARAILNGEISVGIFYSFLTYQAQFSSKAANLFDQIVKWKMTDIYSFRLADIVLTSPESDIDTVNFEPDLIKGGIDFRRVGFFYSQFDRPVFQDVSFTVAPGEFVAIIGPSGSGKSTLLKILCGLYPASLGEVLIDGRAISSWGVGRIRKSLGVVMQDDELLAGTIADNVAFFCDEIDIARVWECLRMAAIEEDVLRMPLRDQTVIGDMGVNLSGGQKQRLILARALYRKPSILVLDEATSHLDVPRERQINDVLKSLKITRIVVAHRRETIEAADRVIYIANGKIMSDTEKKPANHVADSNSEFV
jgi:ATP-binding cassette, subfamily B, bacterial CvaB/MchF/RaxB